MKLYYSPGACSLAVRIVINEIGAPCTFERVDMKTKQTERDIDFKTVNPKSAVPTLALDDGTILTENAVIQQYLADKYQATTLLPAVNTIARYKILEWVNFVSTDLHKTAAPIFNPTFPNEAKDILRKILVRQFTYVDQSLGNRKFLFDDHFTLADPYLFVLISWAPHLEIDLSVCPNLMRYFKELSTRPSVQKALIDEGLQPKGAVCEIPS